MQNVLSNSSWPFWLIVLLLLAGFSAVAPAAIVLELNFGEQSDPTFNQSGDLRMDFTNVAEGVNASLTADAPFAAANPSLHGAVSDDIRVNVQSSMDATGADDPLNDAVFTLQLWDARAGSGFETKFDPGTDYEWSLVFYDLDSGNTASGSWDEVTLLTPGTYILTENSILGGTVDPRTGGYFFSGKGVGEVPGQSGITPPLTEEQADAALVYTVKNLSSVQFKYEVRAGAPNTGRNILIDGGELRTALEPYQPTAIPFPEPSAAVLVLSGLAVMSLCRRRRKMSASTQN